MACIYAWKTREHMNKYQAPSEASESLDRIKEKENQFQNNLVSRDEIHLETGTNSMYLIDKTMSSDCNPTYCTDLIRCDTECDDMCTRDYTFSTSCSTSYASDTSSNADLVNNNVDQYTHNNNTIINVLLSNMDDVDRPTDYSINTTADLTEYRHQTVSNCDEIIKSSLEHPSSFEGSMDLTVPKGCRKNHNCMINNATEPHIDLLINHNSKLKGKVSSHRCCSDIDSSSDIRHYKNGLCLRYQEQSKSSEPIQLCNPEPSMRNDRHPELDTFVQPSSSSSPTDYLYYTNILSKLQEQASPQTAHWHKIGRT